MKLGIDGSIESSQVLHSMAVYSNLGLSSIPLSGLENNDNVSTQRFSVL